jgi:hypothetical protein
MAAISQESFLQEKKSMDIEPPKGSGIVFFGTEKLNDLKDFYIGELGCQLWLDQGTCLIFRYDNLLLGFCQGKQKDSGGIITFFYEEKADVDLAYKKFRSIASGPPKENRRYRIYHFFAKDPEGRVLEFQHFLHPLRWEFRKGEKND